jgi:hypothetical protein
VLGFLAGGTLGAGEARAGADVVDLADEALAEPIGGDADRPAGELLPAALVGLGAHPVSPGRGAQLPRSIGTPTRLPHSVHDPS